MNDFQTFLNGQARACICGSLGHRWKAIIPLQINHETRSLYCQCATCTERGWLECKPGGYERLLQDVAAGKFETASPTTDLPQK